MIAAVPVLGDIAASYLVAKKVKEIGDVSFSKEDVNGYLQEEIERYNQFTNQKLVTIE